MKKRKLLLAALALLIGAACAASPHSGPWPPLAQLKHKNGF
jgi:hypothetical protein